MRGLLNLGNTCYFNTAIQCLAHVPALSRHFFSSNLSSCNCILTCEYQKVVIQLFLKDKTDPVNPSALLSAFRDRFPSFRNLSQHDSQEVIILMIDVFEKSIGREFIVGLFNGQEAQETIYPGGRSVMTNTFTTLILPVEEPSTLHSLLEESVE